MRDAVHTDIPALLDMGKRFADKCGLERIAAYDERSMASTFRNLIDADLGILLIAEKAAAGGLVHPAYWNADHLTGQELFWWCEGTGQGLRMFRALEQSAKDRGAQSWGMITLDSVEPEKTGRFYERAGYRKSEHSYIKVF